MTTEEELRTVADALESSLTVVGCGPRGTTAAERFDRDAAATGPSRPEGADRSTDRQATVVGVAVDDVAAELRDGADANGSGSRSKSETLASVESAFRGSDGFAVVVASIPSRFDGSAGRALERLRGASDAVVLVPEGTLSDALGELFALVGDAGVVNLDLADVRTLLSPDGIGVLSWGSSPASTPEDSVPAALGKLVSGVDVADAGGALVDVVGTPALTVDEAASLVDRVRSRIDDDAHVIWGTAVEEDSDGAEDAAGRVRVRLLVSGVRPPEPTPAPGDPCPRCGGTLSGYSLGERTTIACDACGYAGVSRR